MPNSPLLCGNSAPLQSLSIHFTQEKTEKLSGLTSPIVSLSLSQSTKKTLPRKMTVCSMTIPCNCVKVNAVILCANIFLKLDPTHFFDLEFTETQGEIYLVLMYCFPPPFLIFAFLFKVIWKGRQLWSKGWWATSSLVWTVNLDWNLKSGKLYLSQL